MIYESTRSDLKTISSSEAILKGIAEDGGLYVPSNIPKITKSLNDLADMSYKDLALYIMKSYFTDFEEQTLIECINNAYNDKFDTPQIAPLVSKNNLHFLELYHGPTLAFKDMALTLLPHIMKAAAHKSQFDKEIVILTATSGDTGKAALEGFSKVEGTKIIVFFPQNGVSDIQKRQMLTQEGENTLVVGIEGNFDDTQNGVKYIFNDAKFTQSLNQKGYMFSSANSINVGRLVPQIVYYFYAYLTMLREGRLTEGQVINAAVPTGNFGNILAAYYAKRMGLPIKKLICASNENNVLYDFLNTGIYDRRRKLKLTSSPSMDILISSNLERLLYEISGRDKSIIVSLMEKLNKDGIYEIPEYMKNRLEDFYGGYALEKEALDSISKVYSSCNYLMDTHTAVAYSVWEKYKAETGDDTQTLIVSTASPFKFGSSVCSALGIDIGNLDEFSILERLSAKTNIEIPKAIQTLRHKSIIHSSVCEKEQMKSVIEKFLRV